jgi:hypothetical protein
MEGDFLFQDHEDELDFPREWAMLVQSHLERRRSNGDGTSRVEFSESGSWI